MTLYEIDQRLETLVDPETGELLDYEAFQTLQIEREAKIENTALWVKELTAQVAAIKAEISSLEERRKAAERKADRLKEYLSRALDGKNFSTARCDVTFRRSAALEIENEDALVKWVEVLGIDDVCLRYKDPEINKRAVANLIKSGVDVPHARIFERTNIRVK